MELSARTDIGNKRAENQDSYRAQAHTDGKAWLAVCDGMGGARGGRLASGLAVASIEQVLCAGLPGVETDKQARALLEQAVRSANEAVYEKALATPAARGMGTTVVCGVCRGGMLQYAHVGDSRIYLFHGHSICQLTKDHSIVQELVEQGSITAEEAAFNPRKNLITRALGVGPQVEVDFGEIVLSPGDILVLCTDGLSNYVTVDEMEEIIQNTGFYNMADALVNRALEAGGLDNVTVLLAKCEATEENNG